MKKITKKSSFKTKITSSRKQPFYSSKKLSTQKNISSSQLQLKKSYGIEQKHQKIIHELNLTNRLVSKSKKIARMESQPSFQSHSRQKKQPTTLQNLLKKTSQTWTQLDKISYQLSIQKKLRQSLQQQNEMLKKQIAFLNSFSASSSLRTSFNNNNKKINHEEVLISNKQKIINRLNKKRQGIVSNTEGIQDNQSTKLYNTKMKNHEDNITQLYDQYLKNQLIPQLDNIYQVMKKYFYSYKDNYSKLFILYTQINQKLINKYLHREILSQIQNLLFLFQIPILYKQKLFQPPTKQFHHLNSSIKQIPPKQKKSISWYQYQSPQQILQQFQKIINLILKNSHLVNTLNTNQCYLQLVNKTKNKI